MRRRRVNALWLVVPSLWAACEVDRSLGHGPGEPGDAGAAGDGNQAGAGAESGTAGRGGAAGRGGSSAASGTAGTGGAAAAGGSESDGGAPPGGSAGTLNAGGCGDEPNEPFDVSHCETPTFTMGESTCTAEQTRAAIGCGEPGSQFDASCCRRDECTDDADCGSDGRCLPRIVQTADSDGINGSEVESCSSSCGACGCSVTEDIDVSGYCVSDSEGLSRFDCPVRDVDCESLANWRLWVEAYRDVAIEFREGEQAGVMQACIERIVEELIDRCGGCGDEPNEPFDVSHCDSERRPFFSGNSTCDERQTREALGCGEPGSKIGPDCCVRQGCLDDASCGSGRCIPRTLNVPGSFSEVGQLDECESECGRCSCSGTADSGPEYDAYCVTAAEDLESFDCPVTSASCTALEIWGEGLPAYRDEFGVRDQLELAAAVETCLGRVATELAARCGD